jgi:dTDP-4-amino-4,6-dideoxygalactose transaminase
VTTGDADNRVMDDCMEGFCRILSSKQFIDGENIALFEAELVAGSNRTAITARSGMDAFELVLESIGPEWGDKVFLPANCFQSLPAMVVNSGRNPVPIDIDRQYRAPVFDGWSVDVPSIILWVHHCGTVHPEAIELIRELRSQNCFVIEDFAYGIPDLNSLAGNIAMLTFAPTKPLGGTGGAVLFVEEEDQARQLAKRRYHGGQEHAWEGGDVFFRMRAMDEVSALLARSRFAKWESNKDHLLNIQNSYADHLENTNTAYAKVLSIQPNQGRLPVILNLPIAPAVCQKLRNRGIAASIMYDRPWFDYSWFHDKMINIPEKLSVDSLRFFLRHVLCLPMNPYMAVDNCAHVVEMMTHSINEVAEMEPR